MKLIEFLKGQRKVLIFLLCIAAYMVGSLWMIPAAYNIYCDGLMIIAVSFFAGNGIEHIASAINRKIDSKIEQK